MTPRWPRVVALAVVAIALLAGAYAAKQILFSGAATTRTTARLAEARIVALINVRRVANGLEPVRADNALHELALAHSIDMLTQSYFAHDSPTGSSFDQRTSRLHRREVAENIAWGTGGYRTPAGIVSLWMASPGHRRIILTATLRRVGVGVADGTFEGQGGARLATADFSS